MTAFAQRIVQQVERLGGDGRRIAAAGNHALLCKIENLERVGRQSAEQRQIDAAMPAVGLPLRPAEGLGAVISQFANGKGLGRRRFRSVESS